MKPTPVVIAAALLSISAGAACTNTEQAATKPPSHAAVQLALRNARCVLLAQMLRTDEVSQACARPVTGVEEIPSPQAAGPAGARCLYRFAGGGHLDVSFAGPAEAGARGARAEFAPTAPVLAPALGPHGLAFYDAGRGRNAFYFDVRGEGVRVLASTAGCDVGPLSRVARILRERLGGAPAPK